VASVKGRKEILADLLPGESTQTVDSPKELTTASLVMPSPLSDLSMNDGCSSDFTNS